MVKFRGRLPDIKNSMYNQYTIRNVCILAHIDHGKTTVADQLLSTNRYLSKRMVGVLRIMDDRQDEQLRGITMKSSAATVLNTMTDVTINRMAYMLLTIVDTPGHIDFSAEVGSAVRICDGALILVDAAEGVGPQTKEAIKVAFTEQVKMILVINKIDRLVLDLKLSLEGMFQRINKIIETCNAFIAELYQYSDSGCTKLEETGLLFLPPTGNVIFASALHGWSFTTKLIADKMFSNVEGEIDEEALNEKIWNFDLWLDSKKNIKTGAINKGKSNLFIQLCLQPVYHVYHTLGIKLDKDKAQSIIDKLGIEKIPGITLNSNETINQIKAIMAAWQPFDLTVLLQIQCIFPCPVNITQQKIDYLLNAHRYIEDPYLNRCISNITTGFQKHFVIQPIICYVAKTFCVNIKNLTYTMQLQRRFQPRIYPRKTTTTTTTITKRTTTPQDTPVDSDNSLDKKIKEIADEIVVMALTKIYIGKLFVGKELYVLQQGYVPNQHELMTNCDDFVASNPYIHKVVIKELFIFVGKHLHSVDQVPAGNICAIKITDEKMVKGVTLSSILEMVPLIEHPSLPPVVKYAIEPVNPRELSILRHGLKLLTLSDPCVQVKTQENGEMVMLTAGDLHQEKCIEDLTRHFAKIELKVSDPIVSLRETVKNTIEEPFQYASVKTPYMDLSVTVVSLPKEIAKVIQDNYDLFETVEEIEKCSIFDIIRMFQNPPERREVQIKTFTNETINRAVKKLLKDLADASSMCGSNWTLLINRIWSVSKTRDSPNLLLNNCSDLSLSIFMETDFWDKRSIMARYISTAYQTFLKAGPICEEPISHCAFIINSFNLLKDLEAGDINAQVIAFEDIAVRNAFKEAFQKRDQRIMDPVYNTNIRLSMAVVGDVYDTVGKYEGNVIEAIGMDENEENFLVKAEIPVRNSSAFTRSLLAVCSGRAVPTMTFGQYKMIDGNPFVEPNEEDFESHFQFVKEHELALRAVAIRKEVRRRKGLPVDDEVVTHAEKQRTLKKK